MAVCCALLHVQAQERTHNTKSMAVVTDSCTCCVILVQAQERTRVLKTRVAELEAYSARLEARVETLDKQVGAQGAWLPAIVESRAEPWFGDHMQAQVTQG
jgi:hypothetical protein